jgi:hypothetical protein
MRAPRTISQAGRYPTPAEILSHDHNKVFASEGILGADSTALPRDDLWPREQIVWGVRERLWLDRPPTRGRIALLECLRGFENCKTKGDF